MVEGVTTGGTTILGAGAYVISTGGEVTFGDVGDLVKTTVGINGGSVTGVEVCGIGCRTGTTTGTETGTTTGTGTGNATGAGKGIAVTLGIEGGTTGGVCGVGC